MSTPHAIGGQAREPLTVRIAMWSARHRWPVAGLWFVFTIGLFVASLGFGGINTEDARGGPNQRSIEASDAYDVFNASGVEPPSEQVIILVGGDTGAVADPAFKQAVGDLVARLGAASATVEGIDTKPLAQLVDPSQAPPAAGLIAADQTTVRIFGHISGDNARVKSLLVPVPAIVDAARAANPTLTIHTVSSTFINQDINNLISSGLDDTLRLTLPLTFLILLTAFGAIVLVSVVGSLTFMPATMSILGDRMNAGRISTWIPRLLRALPLGPISRRANAFIGWLDNRAARQEGAGFWGRLVTAVMGRPISTLVVAAVLLVLLASPVLRLRTGVRDMPAFPPTIAGVADVH